MRSGIGRATSLAFARDGCRKIILGDIAGPELEESRRLIVDAYPDAKVLTRYLDVSDEKGVEDFYSFAVSEFGSIDYGASIAGVSQKATPIHLCSDEVLDKLYAVNQRGVSSFS